MKSKQQIQHKHILKDSTKYVNNKKKKIILEYDFKNFKKDFERLYKRCFKRGEARVAFNWLNNMRNIGALVIMVKGSMS